MRLQIGQALEGRKREAHCSATLGIDTHKDDITQAKHKAAFQWLIQHALWRDFHLPALLPVPTHDEKVCQIVHQLRQSLGPAAEVRRMEKCFHCLNETLELRQD